MKAGRLEHLDGWLRRSALDEGRAAGGSSLVKGWVGPGLVGSKQGWGLVDADPFALVLLEEVVVDGLALRLAEVVGVGGGKLVQPVADRHQHVGAGLLAVAPVED